MISTSVFGPGITVLETRGRGADVMSLVALNMSMFVGPVRSSGYVAEMQV